MESSFSVNFTKNTAAAESLALLLIVFERKCVLSWQNFNLMILVSAIMNGSWVNTTRLNRKNFGQLTKSTFLEISNNNLDLLTF